MPIKLNKLPISERPYEKLEMYGAKSLSNAELLAIIIKTGTKNETAINLAQKVLALGQEDNSLRFLEDISVDELKTIKGIGRVKAIELKAICELAKRITKPTNFEKIIIKTPKDVADIFMEELRFEKREVLKVIILNTKNKIQKIVDVATGGTFNINIKPKDIFEETIKLGMPKIIMVHNHPSGDATPSISDIETTNRVDECAKLFGIELLDHIVIGDGTYKSIFSITHKR